MGFRCRTSLQLDGAVGNHIFLSCLCKQCRPSLSWLRFLLSSLFSILLLLPFYTSSYFSLSSFSSSGFSLHSCSVWKQNQKQKTQGLSNLFTFTELTLCLHQKPTKLTKLGRLFVLSLRKAKIPGIWSDGWLLAEKICSTLLQGGALSAVINGVK